MSKKLFVIFFLFFVSIKTFSEEYLCSYISPDNGEVTELIFERKGDSFIYKSSYSKKPEIFKIRSESEELLYISDEPVSDKDFSIFMIKVNKKNKRFEVSHHVLGLEPLREEGTCIVRN
tara:strand:+ start:163 stop:519 length:357 start_codon:yes stop_codon:yes gene_type:complete